MTEATADKLERLANTQWWDGLEQEMYEAAMDAVRELRSYDKAPHAWVIPGSENANSRGYIDAMDCRSGEFTVPVYRKLP